MWKPSDGGPRDPWALRPRDCCVFVCRRKPRLLITLNAIEISWNLYSLFHSSSLLDIFPTTDQSHFEIHLNPIAATERSPSDFWYIGKTIFSRRERSRVRSNEILRSTARWRGINLWLRRRFFFLSSPLSFLSIFFFYSFCRQRRACGSSSVEHAIRALSLNTA